MLTYCTNIHPGEGWNEVFENLRRHVPVVKAAVSSDEPFPLGLRLSARAADELDEAASRGFADWCRSHGCFVPTLNGFPYGTFHGVPVKESVYLPDWRDPERRRYALRLSHLLASWLPEGATGSVSTVPLGFRSALHDEGLRAAEQNLILALEHLARLRDDTGRVVRLALEPEPGCAVETTVELVGLFERLGLSDRLRPHLAVCYDCCHQAVQFEEPAESLAMLRRAGIPIGHVQVSSALRLRGGDLETLARFSEPVYLHQAVGRRGDGSLVRFFDLPEALAGRPAGVEEWRVHFHVPIFVDQLAECETTQPFLRAILPLFDKSTPLEVETYTWSVLPPDLQMPSVTDSVVREIEWARGVLG